MDTIEETSTKESAIGKLLLIGITTHSGIVGDKDDLFILETTNQELNAKQSAQVLYEFAKITGKEFASWQPVKVDLDFNQTGKIVVFHEHFDPYPWIGEVIRCTPNDKLIEYVKNRCK